jgi:hypothetical protein
VSFGADPSGYRFTPPSGSKVTNPAAEVAASELLLLDGLSRHPVGGERTNRSNDRA